jgi:hypothetical protein
MYDIFRIHKFVNTRFYRSFAKKDTHTDTELSEVLTLLFLLRKRTYTENIMSNV